MLKIRNTLLLALISLALLSCNSNESGRSWITKGDAKRIVLVGGSLISEMENYPHLEVALTKHFHDSEFSMRNIGWAADDVFGMARAQFGSAQNTQSWRPPTAEEGFGARVLIDHIKETNPTTLIIGYGAEVAHSENEEEYELFTKGYTKLLDQVDSLDTKVILLSPAPQLGDTADYHQSLSLVTEFIKDEAGTRDYKYIDLNKNLKNTANPKSSAGHKAIATAILEEVQISIQDSFHVELDEEGSVVSCEHCSVKSQNETVNGIKLALTPSKGIHKGSVSTPRSASVSVNGSLESKSGKVNRLSLGLDSQRNQRLISTIKEKNRLFRYRLRPLNEAYIYLFRQHEMGHLAYERDDLLKLVEEKEREIASLIKSYDYDVEVEMEKAYNAPKQYADDEIPAFIPEPDTEAELSAFQVADGYEVTLFAQDPMIANPINVNWDTKGRAWVATSSTYPHIVPGREPNDKIIILEDTDGDGVADQHKVFAENLLVPHSVMPVKGGAYVTATTQLLFLADHDGDDRADETIVIYDGFGNADVHHTIHSLRWMPWGDLHFIQGIYINTFLETSSGVKRLNGSGVWSFRPENEEINIYSRGLVNPWGEVVDEWGQTFGTDGAGSSGMNYIYPGSAHLSAVGTTEILPGLNSGTPKYTAAAIMNSPHFPEDMQGSIVTNDFRANRTVRYELEPKGSSYSSEEVEMILFSEHRSYRPVDTKVGPDGALYIVDWYNPIIDHGEVDFHHPLRDKKHGRIWKVTRKGVPLEPVLNFQEADVALLLEALKSPSQVTRLLANRALVEKEVGSGVVKKWIRKLNVSASRFHQSRLEGMWLLAALNQYDEELLLTSLRSRNYRERAAAVRLISHYDKGQDLFSQLEKAVVDSEPQVRLEALHALKKLASYEAVSVAMNVLDNETDTDIDYALRLLLEETEIKWLGRSKTQADIFSGDSRKKTFALLTSDDPAVIQDLRELLEEGELSEEKENEIWRHLAKIGDAETLQLILSKSLEEEDASLLEIMNSGSGAGGNITLAATAQALRKIIRHDSLDMTIAGVNLVGSWEVEELSRDLEEIIEETEDRNLLTSALGALQKMGSLEKVKAIALNHVDVDKRAYATAIWAREEAEAASKNVITVLQGVEADEPVEQLIRSFARVENGPQFLINELEGVVLPEEIASAGMRVVQRVGLNLVDLEEALRKAGSITAVGNELTDEDKDLLLAEAASDGDKYRGKIVYRKQELMCGSCHVVRQEGGLSGPYLGKIGSFMTPRAILESVINPNAVIKQNYETMVITKKNGEVVSGVLDRKLASAMRIRQANGQVVEVRNADITETKISDYSLMPAGLTRNLNKDELRDLLAYLMSLGTEES